MSHSGFNICLAKCVNAKSLGERALKKVWLWEQEALGLVLVLLIPLMQEGSNQGKLRDPNEL